jgi:hypothetical protein
MSSQLPHGQCPERKNGSAQHHGKTAAKIGEGNFRTNSQKEDVPQEFKVTMPHPKNISLLMPTPD